MTPTRHTLGDVPVRSTDSARKAGRARLSIVVVGMGDSSTLIARLAAVLPACREVDAEVIVVRAGGESLASTVAHHPPGLRVIAAPVDAAPSALRDMGMRAAQGDIVLFRSEHDAIDLVWLAPFLSHGATRPAGDSLRGASLDRYDPVRPASSVPHFAEG